MTNKLKNKNNQNQMPVLKVDHPLLNHYHNLTKDLVHLNRINLNRIARIHQYLVNNPQSLSLRNYKRKINKK